MRVCLISGASRGIGRAAAEMLYKAGWSLLLLARDQEQLSRVAAGLSEGGRPAQEVRWVGVDVTDAVALRQAVAVGCRGGWKLNAVVAAAGVELLTSAGSIHREADADAVRIEWDRQLAVNLSALAATVLYSLPYAHPDRLSIVLLSSVAATANPMSGLAMYQASKAAVSNLADGLHSDLAFRNVRVSALCPGLVATEMGQNLRHELRTAIHPGAEALTVQDVAHSIRFLVEWPGTASLNNLLIQPMGNLSVDLRPHWDATFARGEKRAPLDPIVRLCKFPVAIVSGASKGIGHACGLALARQGYALVIIARHAEALEQAAIQFRALGAPEVTCMAFDVADGQQVAKVIEFVANRYGELTAVVASAGINRRLNAVHSDWEDVKQLMDINVRGTMNLCLGASRLMARGGKGNRNIVIIGSWASYYANFSYPGMSSYWASKCAQHGFATGLLEDVRPLGIKVSLLMFGMVNNDLGNVQGPIAFERDGFVQLRDVELLMDYILSCSETACPSHILVKPGQEILPSYAQLAREQGPSNRSMAKL